MLSKKAEKKYGWNYSGIEYYIHDVWVYLAKKKGPTEADKDIYPLKWWVNTGRATLGEIKAMYQKKPYRIGQILMNGGSVDDAVCAIKKYIAK